METDSSHSGVSITKQEGPMNITEAAKYLHIAKGTLYNLVHLKKITHYKPMRQHLLFYREDLDAFIHRGQSLADFELHKKAEEVLNANRSAHERR